MSKTALIILAEGAEESETVITADVLVRGGIEVTIAGLESDAVVKCSRNVLLKPHASLQSVQNNSYDCLVLPGGLAGAKALAGSQLVGELLRKQLAAGNAATIIAAICAAPIALQSHGIASGICLTSHPSVKEQLTSYCYSEERVYVDNSKGATIVTSRGPGTAFEFGLKLVELMQGVEKAKALVPPMLLNL